MRVFEKDLLATSLLEEVVRVAYTAKKNTPMVVLYTIMCIEMCYQVSIDRCTRVYKGTYESINTSARKLFIRL